MSVYEVETNALMIIGIQFIRHQFSQVNESDEKLRKFLDWRLEIDSDRLPKPLSYLLSYGILQFNTAKINHVAHKVVGILVY